MPYVSTRVQELQHEITALKLEIAAIKRRERTYVEQGRWDEMIPWFDLTDDEREVAIEYWGPDK